MNNNCEIGQATHMADIAGIKLEPNQIEDYVFARQCLDKEFTGECDQVLLDLVLNPLQTIQFRKTFNNIFHQ